MSRCGFRFRFLSRSIMTFEFALMTESFSLN